VSNQTNRDFDKTGLGIGGLGRYVEPVTVPTVEQIERLEHLEQQLHHCRRCGCSEMDGAMFTTDPASGLCDDCCG